MRGKLTAPLLLALALVGCGGDNRVKVPDVTGIRALDAQRTLGNVGLSSKLDPKPASPTKCMVTDQSVRGRVPPKTEVVLKLSCPYREGED